MILETRFPELCPFELKWKQLYITGLLYHYTIPPPEVEAAILLMLIGNGVTKIKGHDYVALLNRGGYVFTGATRGSIRWINDIMALMGLS